MPSVVRLPSKLGSSTHSAAKFSKRKVVLKIFEDNAVMPSPRIFIKALPTHEIKPKKSPEVSKPPKQQHPRPR